MDAFAVDRSRGDELGFVGGGGDVVVARGGVLEDGAGGFGGQIAVVLAGGVEFAVFFTESDASLGHPYLRFDVRAEEVVDERAADVVVALAAQDVVTGVVEVEVVVVLGVAEVGQGEGRDAALEGTSFRPCMAG